MNREEKFRKLLKDNAAVIAKICRLYTDTADDFNDYYQEVALQLWRSFKTFRGEAQLSTWVYRVALNVCLSQFKQQKKKVQKEQAITTHEYVIAHAEDPLTNEQIQALYVAIRQLKEVERALILLFLEDKSYKEISEILGISVNLVGVRLNRVKQQLKKMMHG